jgi:phosphate transport system substrate-binding protein
MMKPQFKPLVLAVVLCVASLVAASPGNADFVLNASCSSQIAEAFQRELMENFMAESGVKVNLHVFSSQVCLNRLKNGFSNVAGSTIRITQEDRDAGLIEIPVFRDPMVVITNAECGCTTGNLALTQVRQVFSGHYTNWSQLGGKDLPITRIIPAEDTGAYKNFQAMAMGPFEIRDDLIAGKTFTALTSVKYIPGSLSFITRAIAIQHPEVSVITIDGVDPSSPDYPYHQTFSIVIKGQPSPMMKQALKYMMSDKARQRMIDRGMQPLF